MFFELRFPIRCSLIWAEQMGNLGWQRGICYFRRSVKIRKESEIYLGRNKKRSSFYRQRVAYFWDSRACFRCNFLSLNWHCGGNGSHGFHGRMEGCSRSLCN